MDPKTENLIDQIPDESERLIAWPEHQVATYELPADAMPDFSKDPT